jgi:transposase InsO family protein
MKNLEKEIEIKARELNRYKTKLIILDYISKCKHNIEQECKEFGISKRTYYNWKIKFERDGPEGLKRQKPVAYNHPNKISEEVVDKILELRKVYQLGSTRITWYLERYHGIKVSESSVHRTLARNGVNRLPKNASRRTVHTKRYSKKVPGHHVQVDVIFITLKGQNNKAIRRYQYTAIDDATRIRALKIYDRHNQANAIDFIKYVVDKFPFRIHTIRTDRGHEFQAKFHWFVEDMGMRHAYIKPRSPQLNGKVERSHRTDQEEFYQLFSYTDDVDLNKKLKAWENFYNFNRPHGAFNGKTPYEVLLTTLKNVE